MPATGLGSTYYTYAYGPATWVAMSTEHNYSAGSPQWQWLDATLASVDRSVTPWLFLTLHRPIYSMDSDEAGDHTPGGPLSVALEPLLHKHGVDVVWQGHQHTYERTAAVRNGTVVALPDAAGRYTSPGAPVYIVQGNTGADLDINKWVKPTPAWNLVHDAYYGFGRLSLSTEGGSRVLSYEAVDTSGVVKDSWSIAKPL
jgi:hypothetical protein